MGNHLQREVQLTVDVYSMPKRKKEQKLYCNCAKTVLHYILHECLLFYYIFCKIDIRKNNLIFHYIFNRYFSTTGTNIPLISPLPVFKHIISICIVVGILSTYFIFCLRIKIYSEKVNSAK